MKTGKLGHKQIQQIDQNMDEHEVASIGKADLKVSLQTSKRPKY